MRNKLMIFNYLSRWEKILLKVRKILIKILNKVNSNKINI